MLGNHPSKPGPRRACAHACARAGAVLLAAATLLAAASPAALRAQAQPRSESMPLVTRSLLLDVALAGDALVAVGERGHVLLSSDYGVSWRFIETPTRATLTAVYFADAVNGWAVGHDGVVLRTSDGGMSWQHQYTEGGLENSFLDVHFLDARRGFIAGAYGVFFVTNDGGTRWTPEEIFEEELHFNRIARGPDGRLFIAVEAGEILASGDDGASWEPLDAPYDGSLFGVLALTARTLVTYGLRGNVFRSTDGGDSWEHVPLDAPVLITHAVRLASGPVILAGQSEQFFISYDGGRSFKVWTVPVQRASALIETPDGAVVAVGLNGVWRLQPPRPESLAEAETKR